MPAFILSLLSVGKSVLTAVLTWLSRRSLAEIGCILLGIACAVMVVANRAEKRHSEKLQGQLTKCAQGREADRTAYAKAQAEAAQKNQQHVAQVEAQQKRITNDVEARYRADLSRLRAERGKLQPANGTTQRAADKPGSPATSPTASGSNPKAVPLPADELLRAQETELQLNALIDWVLGQSSVDPNK